MYWKHFLSLSQSWSLIHTGYNELFLKAGAELGLGEGGSEEKEEEEEGVLAAVGLKPVRAGRT